MKMRGIITVITLLGLAACGIETVRFPSQTIAARATLASLPPAIAAQNFIAVLKTVKPVAVSVCLSANTGINCDFQIVVDDRPGQGPNAFQTVDSQGRPIIAFTLPLIADAQNRDELAFIMGHEAAHHIAGHLDRSRQLAVRGAVVAGVLASISGADRARVDRAAQLGAGIGSRRFSKDFELEADLIGTRIALAAGYDPVLGAAFFDRLPDPGNRFLGSHPANRDRKALVQRETMRLRGG